MAVAAPEDEAQAAVELFFALPQEARHLEHGGVGAAVVHGADLPGVKMAAE